MFWNYPRVTELRGWTISGTVFNGRPLWTARRFGVGMNTNSYGGIVSMILNRPY